MDELIYWINISPDTDDVKITQYIYCQCLYSILFSDISFFSKYYFSNDRRD